MRYMCAECGSDIKKPTKMKEPKQFIFSNLLVAEADVECPKCMESLNEQR